MVLSEEQTEESIRYLVRKVEQQQAEHKLDPEKYPSPQDLQTALQEYVSPEDESSLGLALAIEANLGPGWAESWAENSPETREEWNLVQIMEENPTEPHRVPRE